MVAAEGNGGENVFFVAGNYDADRDLAVVGAVGGIEGAAAGGKANFSTKMTAESGFMRGVVELRVMGWGGPDVLWHMV